MGGVFATCEFAYNRALHTTTQLCPFEVVCGFKPITPFDLLPLPLQERVNMEASKRADYVKQIHEKTREAIEKQGKNVAAAWNQSWKEVFFILEIRFGCICARTGFQRCGIPS